MQHTNDLTLMTTEYDHWLSLFFVKESLIAVFQELNMFVDVVMPINIRLFRLVLNFS